jgi:uncharacterized protein (DUF433 family)
MTAVRIHKHLDSPIPQLPELTPMVGGDVEIIALANREHSSPSQINKTPGVSGGSACVGKTRIPVWTLIQLKRLGRDEMQLLEDFPSLSRGDLDAAWDYYRLNTSEIEREIVEQETEDQEDS